MPHAKPDGRLGGDRFHRDPFMRQAGLCSSADHHRTSAELCGVLVDTHLTAQLLEQSFRHSPSKAAVGGPAAVSHDRYESGLQDRSADLRRLRSLVPIPRRVRPAQTDAFDDLRG